MAIMECERDLVAENLKLVYYVLNKEFPPLIFDEDAFQEGCIGLLKAARTYDPGISKFSTYAYITIKQTILQYLKRINAQHRKPEQPDLCYEKYLFGIGEHDLGLTQAEVNMDLERFIRACNDKERFVVRMALHGFTQREIGEMMGVNQVQVSRITGYAMKKMQRRAG
jgi:RNA polymerase sporulation-specific sigma factor